MVGWELCTGRKSNVIPFFGHRQTGGEEVLTRLLGYVYDV